MIKAFNTPQAWAPASFLLTPFFTHAHTRVHSLLHTHTRMYICSHTKPHTLVYPAFTLRISGDFTALKSPKHRTWTATSL